MSYKAKKKRAEPYTKIVEELPEMRRDTLDLVKIVVRDNQQAQQEEYSVEDSSDVGSIV